MAKLLTNRTDNDIKNKWYSMARTEKRINNKFRKELGIDLDGIIRETETTAMATHSGSAVHQLAAKAPATANEQGASSSTFQDDDVAV